MFIYMDETGDPRRKDTKYFIVGSFVTSDTKKLAQIFRKWQKTKFPKRLRSQSEVKFNDSHLTDELRLKTIKFLAKQDIKIFYTFLDLTKLPKKENWKKAKVHKGTLQAQFYVDIISQTLELYLPITENEFHIVRESRSLQSYNTAVLQIILNGFLLSKLLDKVYFDNQDVNSKMTSLVLVADWICGALGRYHEEKPLGQQFYHELKKNIIQAKELTQKDLSAKYSSNEGRKGYW